MATFELTRVSDINFTQYLKQFEDFLNVIYTSRMYKILCIEDSKEYQTLISASLGNIKVVFSDCLKTAREMLEQPQCDFDLLLLDISLPDGSGINFLSEINLTNPHVQDIPIFIVSSDNNELSKITAFGLGVDDYICKPFNTKEFKARIEAKIRKSKDQRGKTEYIVGDIKVHPHKMTLSYVKNNQEIENITPNEFKIFCALIAHPGHILSRAQLIEKVWPHNTNVTERTIDTHLSHLRKKISHSLLKIETVFGVGYKVVL